MIVIRQSKRVARWAREIGASAVRTVQYGTEDYGSFMAAAYAGAGTNKREYLVGKTWISEGEARIRVLYR